MEGEQDDQDEDDEHATPGAVRVPGMDCAGRGDEEDGLTIISEQSSTVVAQLVEENEREQLEEELRQKLEEELRQKLHEEQTGQVARAEIVEDDGTNTRRVRCSSLVLLPSCWQLLWELCLEREMTVQTQSPFQRRRHQTHPLFPPRALLWLP